MAKHKFKKKPASKMNEKIKADVAKALANQSGAQTAASADLAQQAAPDASGAPAAPAGAGAPTVPMTPDSQMKGRYGGQ